MESLIILISAFGFVLEFIALSIGFNVLTIKADVKKIKQMLSEKDINQKESERSDD